MAHMAAFMLLMDHVKNDLHFETNHQTWIKSGMVIGQLFIVKNKMHEKGAIKIFNITFLFSLPSKAEQSSSR